MDDDTSNSGKAIYRFSCILDRWDCQDGRIVVCDNSMFEYPTWLKKMGVVEEIVGVEGVVAVKLEAAAWSVGSGLSGG